MADEDEKKVVLDLIKKILYSLEVPGDEGREMFVSTLAPRGLAIHARSNKASDSLQFEEFREGFADRIPWNSGVKTVEGIDGEATVMVDHDVAMVWIPYWFTMNGALNHVGTNVFTLIKRDWNDDGNQTWLICTMTDTARKPSEEDVEKHEARNPSEEDVENHQEQAET